MGLDSFTDKQFQDTFKKVYEDIIRGVNPDNELKAILLGGQPGSGKKTIHSIAMRDNPNIILIDGDEFRYYHPNFDRIQKRHGNNAVKYTQKFSNQMVEHLIDRLSSEKYNLLIEGTLRTSQTPLKTCDLLKSKGYSVELSVMAVFKEVSWQGTIQRYEEMKALGLPPRATPKESHDVVVNSIVQNIDELYNTKKFDNITLYNRNQECLYSMNETPNITPAWILNNVLHEKNLSLEEFIVHNNIISSTEQEVQGGNLSWETAFPKKSLDTDESQNEYMVKGCTPMDKKVMKKSEQSIEQTPKQLDVSNKKIDTKKKATKL